MRAKNAVGAYGEQMAVRHLVEAGLTVLARNWRCDLGEIDIVAFDGSRVVVCEVKTRTGFGFGSGLEAVTRTKAARLRHLGRRWAWSHDVPFDALRFDVIAVHLGGGRPTVEHLEAAL